MIGTLESYEKMRGYFGENGLVPVYIEVDDGVRLETALQPGRRDRRSRSIKNSAEGFWRMKKILRKRI